MFQSENGGGYYEAWDLYKNSSLIKKNFSMIEQMSQPFEYQKGEIGFFNEDTLQLNLLKYLRHLHLVMLNYITELDDDQKPNYFQHCLKYKYSNTPKLLIICEQFNIFSNDDGQQVLIYKQYFSEEALNFVLWKPSTTIGNRVIAKQQVNVTILTAFEFNQFTIIKQEYNQNNQEIILICNSNSALHPQLIYITYDQQYNLTQYRQQPLELDRHGALLLKVPWQMGQEFIIQYYTKQYQTCLSVVNVNLLEIHKLLSIKHEQRLSDFYFSVNPKQFIEVYDDPSKKILQQEIQLPDQTEEVIQFVQHTFVPFSIYYFHYHYSTGQVHRFGEKIIYEIMSMMFSTKQSIKEEQEVKKQ